MVTICLCISVEVLIEFLPISFNQFKKQVDKNPKSENHLIIIDSIDSLEPALYPELQILVEDIYDHNIKIHSLRKHNDQALASILLGKYFSEKDLTAGEFIDHSQEEFSLDFLKFDEVSGVCENGNTGLSRWEADCPAEGSEKQCSCKCEIAEDLLKNVNGPLKDMNSILGSNNAKQLRPTRTRTLRRSGRKISSSKRRFRQKRRRTKQIKRDTSYYRRGSNDGVN